MRFYFKKYITVCKSLTKIYFYHLKEKKKNLEFEYSDSNIETIEYLLNKGISKKEIKGHLIYQKLFDNGYLYANDSFQEKSKINRTELFLNYLHDDLTTTEIEEVKKTNILIYGAGGGGSSLIYLLAQFGFHNMTVVDFDKVEISDVQRTMIFDKEDISKSKVNALKDRIFKNFSITLDVYEGHYSNKNEMNKLINKVRPDFVINVCDPKPSFKLSLNELCFEHKIPYIAAAYSYETVYFGPIYIPSVTSCENSFDKYLKETLGEDHSYRKIEKLFPEHLLHPSNVFNINILASLTFKEILLFLLGKFDHCQTIGQRVFFDTITYTIYSRKANCDKTCSVCQ